MVFMKFILHLIVSWHYQDVIRGINMTHGSIMTQDTWYHHYGIHGIHMTHGSIMTHGTWHYHYSNHGIHMTHGIIIMVFMVFM